MEKNTILAVVLSSLVLIGFYFVQGTFSPKQQNVQTDQYYAPDMNTAETGAAVVQETQQQPPQPQAQPQEQFNADFFYSQEEVDPGPGEERLVKIETDLLIVELTNTGGNIVSYKLKEHLNDKETNEPVEMIFRGDTDPSAFSISLGGRDTKPSSALFHVRYNEYAIPKTVEFYREFPNNSGGKYTLTKKYEFIPGEYMFKLTVTISGGYSGPYTLSFAPQIGPSFKELDGRNDFRQFQAYSDGKLKKVSANESFDSRSAKWAAVTGKYFLLIAIPLCSPYDFYFSERQGLELKIPRASILDITRHSSSSYEDTFLFYLGPKTQNTLAIYGNPANNGFNLRDNIAEAADSTGFLAPLEKILKWLLIMFHKIVPNYGIAIILLTLLVKILFFPLTKKGSMATIRMQALAPKIKEIQEKYKDNRQKLNIEMANFYKQEGYNPVSGCLPMLLQIPIFFAMYNLFNSHFDLRGAVFIPGWIPDLSVPESIVKFPEGFVLPILGWTALRLLPFIYVGSQLIYGKVTQTPGQQSNTQTKLMLYVMPIVFFFILYNMPSGLLIYWIFSNILTLVQQLIINKYFLPKRSQTEQQPVIAPGRKKRKKF
jgi:YidC/Oxa1 family membrane protein insertase